MKKIRLSVACTVLLCILHSCTSPKPPYVLAKDQHNNPLFKNKKELFENYTVCSCISYTLKVNGHPLNDQSKEYYLDISAGDLTDNFEWKQIDSMVKSFVDNRKDPTLQTYENRNMPIAGCISFTKNKRVQVIIDSLVNAHKKKHVKF